MVLWIVLVLLLGVIMVFGCVQSLVGLGVSGLVMTVVVSLLLGVVFSYWVGMAVFLVYVGGLMVLFCYFIVIVPNQRFRAKFSWIGLLLGLSYMAVVWVRGYGGDDLVNFSFGVGAMEVGGLYSFENFAVLVMLAVVLLLALLAVVDLVELGRGPLRPFKGFSLVWVHQS